MRFLELFARRRARRTDELAEELRTHLELAAADRVARGESPTEAAANARREFGNSGLVLDISRDQWSGFGNWLERLGQDVRIALRVLRRTPGFSTVAILTIALGIGATTAIFSVVNATLLHPLPYPRAGQLVRIEDDLAGTGSRAVGMSTPEWRDLQRSGVFEAVSPAWFDDNNMTGPARAQRVGLLIVAPNYFAMLRVKPQIGATFDSADATPGFNGQAVISDGLWERAFGRDPAILGRFVQLDSDSYHIVGVMPRGFQAPSATRQERATEVWVAFGFSGAPLDQVSSQSRTPLFPGAFARIRDGLTLAEAQRRVDALAHALRRQFPVDYPAASGWRIRLVPLREHVVGDVRSPLLLLMAAVGLLLLIACANVANLLLARATARGREMAVRQAIGGSPSRLVRQLLTESVTLSSLGGLTGVALLLAGQRFLIRLVPAGVPMLSGISIDWMVLLFACVASAAAGIVFGLAPAMDVRRIDVTRMLKVEGRGATGTRQQKRTRRLLVVGELALSLVLMISAGLLVRSFQSLANAPLGFDARNVTIVHTRLPYPNDSTEDLYGTVGAEAPFVREVTRRAMAIPGVESAALGSGAAVPLDHPEQDQNALRVRFDGRPLDGQVPTVVTGSQVTPAYFHLLGLTLLRGRLFSDFDTDESPQVAVINQAMARAYWPGQDALGKRLKLSRRDTAWTTVVGIIADARTESLASPAIPLVYASLYQRQGKHLAIFLRGHFETAAMEKRIRNEVQTINPALPVFGAETLDDAISGSLAVRRFSMRVIELFAVTALLLASLGIYGVIAYTVSERTQEIGVRVALGAARADILRMILAQGAASSARAWRSG